MMSSKQRYQSRPDPVVSTNLDLTLLSPLLSPLLSLLSKGKQVIFDLSEANLIDSTVLEFIYYFRAEYQRSGGTCEITGLHKHYAVAKHPLSVRRALRG